MKSRLAWIVAAALAAGCAATLPQNAEEFRQMAPGAFRVQVENFEVKRPVRQVGDTWRRRAPECLNVTVRTTSSAPGSYQVFVVAYKPTVVAGAQHAELHLQMKHLQGVVNVQKEPEGGRYMFVADADPSSQGMTKVRIIGPKGYEVVFRAIRAWADGSSQGCPDLTKIG